jgi:hypothetical protein
VKPSGVLDMGRLRRCIRREWVVSCSAAKVATTIWTIRKKRGGFRWATEQVMQVVRQGPWQS